jgi:hypothetical protein
VSEVILDKRTHYRLSKFLLKLILNCTLLRLEGKLLVLRHNVPYVADVAKHALLDSSSCVILVLIFSFFESSHLRSVQQAVILFIKTIFSS